MATNVLLPGLITDPPSPPQNNTWAPTGLVEQALRNAQNPSNIQPTNPGVTGIGVNQTNAPVPTYNPNVTSIGFNQTSVPIPTYNPYMMWGAAPMLSGLTYAPYAALADLPFTNGNVPTTSLDNNLLSMGFQRGVAVR
jgi:hypothetical protein